MSTTQTRRGVAQEPAEREVVEEAASVAEFAAGGAVRGIEVLAAVLIGLLVCPPLFILVVVVVVPLAATILLLTLVWALLAAPYLLVRHLRGHRGGHAPLFVHRLRHAGHALLQLAPHRIHADAREFRPGR